MKYKFCDAPEKGTHVIEDGYDRLEITDQIAEIDKTNKAQVKLAERYGGVPVVANVVEKKASEKPSDEKPDKKAAESEPKK